MPQRIYEAPFKHGEFAFWPLILKGKGASTHLHAHKYAQVALFYPGPNNDAKYRVHAIGRDGRRVELERDKWGLQYLGPNVDHAIELIEGDEGAVVCMFATHDPGAERLDVLAQADRPDGSC